MNGATSFALRSAAWIFALALVALPVIGVMQGWFAVGRWPLRQLVIDGSFAHVDAGAVRAAVRPHANAGFFAVRLGDVRAAIEKLPWVATVDVRKRWPDVLEVRLREREAAAIWQDTELVDVNGKLFAVPPATVPAGLPRFAGPRARVGEMLAFHEDMRARLLRRGQRLDGVQMSRRGGWLLRLGDRTEIVLDGEHGASRLERYLDVQPAIDAPATTGTGSIANAAGASPTPAAGDSLTYDATSARRVDLRYANGFAISSRIAAPTHSPRESSPVVPAIPVRPPLPANPNPQASSQEATRA